MLLKDHVNSIALQIDWIGYDCNQQTSSLSLLWKNKSIWYHIFGVRNTNDVKFWIENEMEIIRMKANTEQEEVMRWSPEPTSDRNTNSNIDNVRQ